MCESQSTYIIRNRCFFINISDEFLLGRTSKVSIDGKCSGAMNILTGVLGPLLFIIYTGDMWQRLKTSQLHMLMMLFLWLLFLPS